MRPLMESAESVFINHNAGSISDLYSTEDSPFALYADAPT